MTQNIRSINRNLPGLEVLLQRLKLKCDILILTECWLKSATVIPHLSGYSHLATNTNPIQNDGVVIYYKENINLTIIEPEFHESNCLLATVGKQVAIMALYRSPSYTKLEPFLLSLDNMLQSVSSFEHIVVIGDMNLAINSDKIKSEGERYLTLAASHGLLPAHTLVTRSARQTCIDHVLIKTKASSNTIVPNATLTDHHPVLFCLNLKKPRQHATTTKAIINDKTLAHDISHINFDSIYQTENPNTSLNYLTQCLQKVIEKNTKIVTLSRRQKIIKPWITPGLLRCMRNRDQLHKNASSDPDNEVLKITYKRYRNFCNSLLRRLKRAYEKNQILEAQNDNKKLWKVIKNITHTTKTKQHHKDLLTLSSSPDQSLHEANSYFINVGSSLADKISQQNINARNLLLLSNTQDEVLNAPNSFVLIETDKYEIEHLIMGLKTDSAPGCDNISSRFLKQHKNILVHPLEKIFNDCLKTGVFPYSLKRSEVCPIYKNGDRSRINNYRPISILPAISKILEKIINTRLVKYLEKNNLLSVNQYGFRHGKSTEQAVNKLIEFISSNLDKRKKCLSIFLDLAKAFDTISVSLLLNKLEALGIRGTQLELFKSYLSGRTQCVRVDKYKSTHLPVTHGVPQGSILGPTLFLVYINELTRLKLTKGEIISFADDTALVFAGDSWDEVFTLAQNGLDMTTEWLQKNILTLNVDKTKYICFSIRQAVSISGDLRIVSHVCNSADSCACSPLERVNTLRYLGITLDNNLNFKEHVKILCNRVRKLIYVFKNLRHVVDPALLKRIYQALCQSLLTYCLSSWGGICKTTLKSVEVAQRAILKVSTFKPMCFPTVTLFQLCEVLTVRQLFILKIIMQEHNKQPYNPMLLQRRRKHHVCDNLTTFKTTFGKRFVSFLGPYLYNKLNKSINIYTLTRKQCKLKVCQYLQKLSYEETEQLINQT